MLTVGRTPQASLMPPEIPDFAGMTFQLPG
jgi:hypothetical protein